MGHALTCVRPCGLVDVIRLVHVNGHVEEMNRPVKVAEVLKANPAYLVGQCSYLGIVHESAVLPPDAELQLGEIYFLLPTPASEIKPVNFTAPPPLRSTAFPEYADLYPSKRVDEVHISSDEASQLPTFTIEHYDVVAKLLISKERLAEFLAAKEDLEKCFADAKEKIIVATPLKQQLGEKRDANLNACKEDKVVDPSPFKRSRPACSWRPALESILEDA
eukprot:c39401_g1_i1 orf=348-1007(+)